MKRAERYSKIDTLEKLRLERRMLESEITNRELMMQVQYADFRESISITRLFTSLISKITILYPIIDWIKRMYSYFVPQRQDMPIDEAKPTDEAKQTNN